MTGTVVKGQPRGEPVRHRSGRVPGEVVVFALALVARLSVPLLSGGFSGNYGYDASVYYAASDGISHGLVPYRDFVLLHPPGISLVLTPFVWVGRLTSDHTGFVTANLAFTVLGALNAVLVVRVASRLGLERRAALLGGVFYALWFGSIGAEYLARLEPLGSFLALSGLLALVASQRSTKRYLPLACGLAFGSAVSVKIWWVVPLVIVLAWQTARRRPRREVALVAGGAVGAACVINGPFFLLAPSQMWHMVVLDQLGRNRSQSSPVVRLLDLTSIGQLSPHLLQPIALIVIAAVGAAFVGVCTLAWRAPGGELFVLLAVAQIVVLIAGPSWFPFYPDYVAASLSLTVAAAASWRRGTVGAPSLQTQKRGIATYGWAPVAFVALATVAISAVRPLAGVLPFPSARLARGVTHTECVMSDSPMALVLLDALSRDFQHHCPMWVDVTGRTYGVDAARLPRRDNMKWQHDLLRYLLSGNAIVIIRARGTGISRQTMAAIERGGTLVAADHYAVYRTLR